MPHLGWRPFVALLKRTGRAWVDDGAPTMGAALAFYTLFSLAPLAMIAIGLAGFFVGREEAQAALVGEVARLVGEQAALGVEDLIDRAALWERGLLPAVVGIVTVVFGATTVFAELRADLDRIWHHKPVGGGSLMRLACGRLFAFLMVAAIGLLLLASVALTTVLTSAGEAVFGQSPQVLWLTEFGVSFAVVTVLFAMIYKILPSPRLEWRDVWMGAAVTAVLFWIGKFAIALYVSRAGIASSFGAAGTIVVLVMWVYYSAQVFFLGAEFTKEFALRHGSKRGERRPRRALGEMRAANDDGMVPGSRTPPRNVSRPSHMS